MADLSLKIKADFDEATKAFRALADNSEYAEAALDKFSKSMKLDHAERFIDSQERMGSALTATKGQLAAAEAQKAAYGREIERLIKNGFDPEDEAVQKLKKEYDALGKQIEISNEKKKATEAAAKVATGALVALGAAVTAAAGVALKAAADMEDQIASLVPMMGGSTKAAEELFKTIRQEAITTPFEINNITASVRSLMPAFQGSSKEAVKAFRMIGDTAQGNSQKLESITRAYTNAMLSGKVQMKELNTIAGAGVPIFTEMAESMGITVEQLREMSSKGQLTADDLTGAFQKMTSEGGLFYNGMESASDTLNMRMLGLKESLGIVASEIGLQLLPAAKNIVGAAGEVVNSFALWITEGDNLKRLLDTLTYVLAGATAGLVAFLAVTKGAAVIETFSKAIRGMTAALAANPFGAIAVAITAVLIPAIIFLIKNWDMVETYLQQGIARLEFAFKWFGSVVKEIFTVAFNAVKIAGVTLLDFIYGNIIRAVGKLLETIDSALQAVGITVMDKAASSVKALGDSIGDLAEKTRVNSKEAIQNAKDEQDATELALQAALSSIDTAAKARRAELNAAKAANEEELDNTIQTEEAKTAAFMDATNARLEASVKASNKEKDQIKNNAEIWLEANEKKLQASTQFTNGFLQLLNVAGKENKQAAIAAKALAHAEAGIATAVAITKTFGQFGFTPWGIAAAAGVTAAGLAQQITIANTPITAETGADFIVPDLSPRVDSIGVMASAGERIQVTPRGETADSGTKIYQLVMPNGRVLAEAINNLAREGELYEVERLFLGRNL